MQRLAAYADLGWGWRSGRGEGLSPVQPVSISPSPARRSELDANSRTGRPTAQLCLGHPQVTGTTPPVIDPGVSDAHLRPKIKDGKQARCALAGHLYSGRWRRPGPGRARPLRGWPRSTVRRTDCNSVADYAIELLRCRVTVSPLFWPMPSGRHITTAATGKAASAKCSFLCQCQL